MDAARWARVKAVFQEAFEKPPAEQAAILDAACAGDAALREAVARLLRAHAGGEGVLDASPLDEGALTGPVADSDDPTEPATPSRIGPYRVVGLLGRGGMGAVYLAERDEPGLRKTVAVKVVRHGMGTDFVLRRFRTERQILAALEHPGIARLYDGGTTEGGLPYFVMEYVAGQDLLTFCDERRLSVEARLALFARVCAAVQYAHQALVVHRDLKPSNVLVTADGQPKLLDFGIAKLLAPQLTGEALEETASVVRLMTPDYASPEQVRGDPVTTASDVYSLGVILYELLSGHRPYRVKSGAALDLERAVSTDVVPPSAALARTEQFEQRGGRSVTITPAEVSARRQAPPAKLRRRLRGDLDNVVLKAMSRDAAARYATAAELADDIGRHLDGFPVRARAARPRERAAKFLRRHRLAAAAAAAVLLSLVTGLGTALRQARVAEAERRRAEARFQDVRRLANSVIYELHDAIGNLPGATPARRLLVTRALEYLDRLASEARDDRGLQRELADAYRRVGEVQGGGLGANLGDTQGALASYEKALALRRDLASRQPPEAQDVLGLALLEFDLGALRRSRGEAAEAERSFGSAIARFEELQGRGELPDTHRRRIGGLYQRLAEVQAFQGKNAEALRNAEKAVGEAEAGWKERPDDPAARAIVAAASHQLASAMAAADRYPEALERARRARTLLESSLRENPLDAQQTRVLLFVLNGEGNYLRHLDRDREAREVYARALEVAEEALRRDPRDRWSQMGVAVAAGALADALLDGGDAAQSARHYRRAARLSKDAVTEDPKYGYGHLQLASAEYGLARALLSAKDRAASAEGCATLDRVQAFWSGLQARGELPPDDRAALAELPRWRARCRPGR
jgi:non-specific serine/threonine protein kinase/serine/threonine-protein kinase